MNLGYRRRSSYAVILVGRCVTLSEGASSRLLYLADLAEIMP